MLLKTTPLEGAVEIECLPKKDKRGSFVRFFCQKSLSKLFNDTKRAGIMKFDLCFSGKTQLGRNFT